LNYTRVCREELLVYMLGGVKPDSGQPRCRPVTAIFLFQDVTQAQVLDFHIVVDAMV